MEISLWALAAPENRILGTASTVSSNEMIYCMFETVTGDDSTLETKKVNL